MCAFDMLLIKATYLLTYLAHSRNYTVSRKKRATLFLTITLHVLSDCYTFCSNGKSNGCSTVYLLTGLMTS